MKALLEFELPQESEEHDSALKGSHYYSVIDSVFNWIRQKRKYDESVTEDQLKILEELSEYILSELNE